ncbi:DUF3052 domain-containing protein [Oricola thermophila]|uniref:DUF3052 domain-containing protein n=1 Tax=Oricola thermophila TaxID=2742145 RepID=A0A6N1VJP1_9HYPH|nr:DUF3052 domain-containing protein [Oricola thermophila]QKV19975.1 DUF3052 domain-containing protein [Oricola thermophila]
MTLAAAGYSGRPLADKLGMKDGHAALFVGLPDAVAGLAEARDFASLETAAWDALPGEGHYDFVHAFTTERADLEENAETLRDRIMPDGMVWISWPKKSSKVATDITEDRIRDVLLPCGLVDVKVCAVTDIWSGLKLVVRKELRTH